MQSCLKHQLVIKQLGMVEYTPTWERMKTFTARRNSDTVDEFWFLQHYPVFTLGQAGKRDHLLAPGSIDVVQSDRGGQVTYHGPGQLVVYLLIDLKRRELGVRSLVTRIETSVTNLLAQFDIVGSTRRDAPGVYVDEEKVAALGLRIRRGCSLHGLSLNVDMDLEPFTRINPCGYAGLKVTQLSNLGVLESLDDVGNRLCHCLIEQFGYTQVSW
jgi:lipoyl(octanoyl) transferase|tara:strand:+ start:1556 stop:2197 length:642 start_codon:yes stop_codon:yes gene_type:complete